MAAKHPYKKRCSEGGRGGWQGGWRGSPIIGATLGAQKLSFLKFFDVWRPHQYFVYVFHVFFSASAWFACPSLCLEHFPSEMQNLQHGFEAGESERQGYALVPEKPLIILNAVPTWTKLKKTTLQWRVLIMQLKMLATNQTCLPDGWWNFLRIIEPQVQQLQRTLSFFKLFVPKPVSGKRRHTK